MNIWDIVIGMVLVGVVGLAIWKMIKDKKSGKGCCGNCSSCGRKC